jgi:hypothetical protein
MSKAEVLQALAYLTREEKLEVIEVASRLLRQEMDVGERLSLAAAVERMRSFYEPGSELSQVTDDDREGFYEYEDYRYDRSAIHASKSAKLVKSSKASPKASTCSSDRAST